MLRRLKLILGCTAVVVMAACASTPPKPTGAGSTAVLRLLRDWRGVWSGKVRDSPMGPMTYTLYVEEVGPAIRVQMAPQRELELEGMHHEYTLMNFVRGVPVVRYSLSQRNSTQEGELVYQEDISSEDEAIFCPPDKGCVQVKMSFLRIDDRTVSMRAMVHEDRHTEIDLRYSSAKIPKTSAEIEPISPPTSEQSKAPAVTKGAGGEPIDRDVYLEEHVDEDITESSADAE